MCNRKSIWLYFFHQKHKCSKSFSLTSSTDNESSNTNFFTKNFYIVLCSNATYQRYEVDKLVRTKFVFFTHVFFEDLNKRKIGRSKNVCYFCFLIENAYLVINLLDNFFCFLLFSS